MSGVGPPCRLCGLTDTTHREHPGKWSPHPKVEPHEYAPEGNLEAEVAADPGPGQTPTAPAKTYELGIRCLRCHRTSWHPMDVRELYCSHCQEFHLPAEELDESDLPHEEVVAMYERGRPVDVGSAEEEPPR